VEYLRDLIVEAGSDIVVVDQTAPEQEARGLANVRVIVPGLLPIDFGWSRQRALRSPRLLTAPRRAGLLDRDLTEAELHRVPHPFP
jgi:ribosomal protein S12 methylthiotransferase accessory factor